MNAKPPKPIDPKSTDPLEWARRLRRREHLCERLTTLQRAMWREALKHETETK